MACSWASASPSARTRGEARRVAIAAWSNGTAPRYQLPARALSRTAAAPGKAATSGGVRPGTKTPMSGRQTPRSRRRDRPAMPAAAPQGR